MSDGITVMVDRLAPCVPNGRWKYTESCHMFIAHPDLEHLHSFAASIGLKRQWFQPKSTLPHYDLTKAKRGLAIMKGAVSVDRYVMVSVMREWRRKLMERGKPWDA